VRLTTDMILYAIIQQGICPAQVDVLAHTCTVLYVKSGPSFMVRHGGAGAAIVHLLPLALPYDGLSACTPSSMVGTGTLLPALRSQGFMLVCTSALWIVDIDEN